MVNGASGGVSLANVLVNDTLNGALATLLNINLTQGSTTNSNVTLDLTDGSVNVANGTPAGTYYLTYKICDKSYPLICDTATVTVPVSAAPIFAMDDTGLTVNGFSGGTSVTNVLAANGSGVDP